MLLYQWLEDAVKSKGGAKALIYRDTYLSWRGLIHRVDRRAAEFSSIGVRSGDWIGLMLGNVPDFIILSLALSKINAAPVPLDPTTSTRELEMIMGTTPMRGLITRPRGGDATLPPSPSTPPPPKKPSPVKLRKQIPESRRRLQGTLLSCSIFSTDPAPAPKKEEDSIAAILITADSAGDPKPVERTWVNLAAEAKHLAAALELNGDDRALLTVPLFHSFGFDLGFLAALRAGAAIYLEDEVSPSKIIKLVREQKITILPASPTLFEALSRLPAAKPLTHKPLRFLSTGSGLTGNAQETFVKKYGTRPLSCFHSTETGTVSIDVKGQFGDTVGKPLPGVEVRITVPSTDKPAPSGKPGVMWIRSEAVSTLSLIQHPVSSTHVEVPVCGRDPDGWYRSGDLGSLDRAGRIHLQGREDDMVRVDGKRVALGEVEGCIESFPKVHAAQAIVISDPLGGPMVVARVVLKEKVHIDPEAIIDHCARHLSPYKVPRRIEFCKAL